MVGGAWLTFVPTSPKVDETSEEVEICLEEHVYMSIGK